jgi:hypothetical protein
LLIADAVAGQRAGDGATHDRLVAGAARAGARPCATWPRSGGLDTTPAEALSADGPFLIEVAVDAVAPTL